jgi:flagellar hook-associated protein 3 FlgL
MSRVTEGLLYGKADRAMVRTRQKMIENQERAISGKRINRPSDDPQGMMRVMGLNAKIHRNEQALKNMEIANSYLTVTESSLAELTNVLTRAKELAIQMSSSSNQSSDALQAARAEVEELFYQVIQIGNTRIGDHYVFGGYQTERPPFDADGKYFGDHGAIEIEVQPGQRVQLNVTGLTPFMGLEEMPQDEKGMDIVKPEGLAARDPASILAYNRGIDPQEDPRGYEALKSEVGVNIFEVFKGFLSGLETGEAAKINNAIEGLDRAFSQVLRTRANVGALQNAIETNQVLVDSQQATHSVLKSNVIDADTTQVYSDLARNETMLNATLESNKKLLTPSLLDFLK